MPETKFETILATQLRTYAQGGVRPVDRYAVADATLATAPQHGWRSRVGWPSRHDDVSPAPRTTLRLAFVLLLALLIAAAAFTLGPGRKSVVPPAPVQVPTTAVDFEGSADQSVFLRAAADSPDSMDVIAVAADGQERLVRRLEPSLISGDGAYHAEGAAARDGWLSVDVSVDGDGPAGIWMLVDLADPARAPLFVPYTRVIGGSWSGTGWFATVTPGTTSGFSTDVVDADTGVTRTLGGQHLPGGGPDLIWAADGSGIVTLYINDAGQNAFGIQPRDGGAMRTAVPALAEHTGSRWFTQGGRFLDTCLAPGWCLIDRVNVWDADGKSNVEWYSGQLAPDRLSEASFSQDASAVWILLDRVEDGRHVAVVARADAPGQVAAGIGTVDLGPDVAHTWFAGLSGDGGSQVALGYSLGALNGALVDGPTAIVPRTANSRTSLHAGTFVGFVPGAAADAWPGGGAFQPVPDAPIPTAPPQSQPSPSG